MRTMKMMAAAAALSCSGLAGQAQAAKVFTVNGTMSGYTDFSLQFPWDDLLADTGSHTIGTVLTFDRPFSGIVEFAGEYTWYVTNSPFGDANELDYGGQVDATNQKTFIFRNQMSAGWKGPQHLTYGIRSGYMFADPADPQQTYNYTLTGFHAVPEPATWALMILGFGAIGAAMRQRPVTRHAYVERELEQA